MSDGPTSEAGTPFQERSLRRLGDLLLSTGRLWLFAELAGNDYRETDYLKRGTEGAVVMKLQQPVTLTLPPTDYRSERRIPAGGARLRPGETGWIGTGSNRFRVREAIVDHDQGVEYAIGFMESGGFHSSKPNFDGRFRSP